jgi:hypothetical protein
MRQHDEVEAPVPRRQPTVESDEQPVRVGSAVDEEAPAPIALDQHRVALSDVEHGDADPAVGVVGGGDPQARDGDGEQQRDDAPRSRAGATPGAARPLRRSATGARDARGAVRSASFGCPPTSREDPAQVRC